MDWLPATFIASVEHINVKLDLQKTEVVIVVIWDLSEFGTSWTVAVLYYDVAVLLSNSCVEPKFHCLPHRDIRTPQHIF